MPKSLVRRLGWSTLSYGISQAIRLINNVVLARLLAPQIFGLMAVVNSIRVGVELLSDVGLTQNIVSNPRGAEPDFYDTAWTLQALRGLALAGLCLALSVPIARFFNYPELAAILPIASLFFVFQGFDSTGRALVNKQLKVFRAGVFEIVLAALMVAVHIIAALISPTIWALVMGSLLTGATTLIASFLLVPGIRHRVMIDASIARQLMKFGKWVFFSSIVFFFAMNFDRLYFAKQVSLAQLGIYGIARGLADVLGVFVIRTCGLVLYPTVAAAGLAPTELRSRMLRGRRTLLAAAAIGVGLFLALSPLLVRLLYDPRYAEAGEILPILCVGLWFSILTSTNDSILMGLSRPAYPALSNAAKLATYVIGVPLAFQFYGFMAAVIMISVGEVVKYATLWALSHKEHLRFGRDDLVLTLVFAATAFGIRELVQTLGWTSVHPIHLRALLGALGL